MRKGTAIAIAILLIPQLTFAAWWNPISWFRKGPPPETTPESHPLTPEIDTEATNTPATTNIEKTEVKTIEKVVKVDNPELQAKINTLLAENASLKSSLNQCKIDLSKYNATTATDLPNNAALEKQRLLDLYNFLQNADPCGGKMGCTADLKLLPNPQEVTDQIKSIRFLDPSFDPSWDYSVTYASFGNTPNLLKSYAELSSYVSTYIRYSGY